MRISVHKSLIKDLELIAEEQNTSITTLAQQFLQNQIHIYKTGQQNQNTMQSFKQSLTKSLRHVEDDHPIFGGKKPKMVGAIMVTPLEAIHARP